MHNRFTRPFLALILSLAVLLSGSFYVRAEEAAPGEDVSVSETASEDMSSEEGSSAPADDPLVLEESSAESPTVEDSSGVESSDEDLAVDGSVAEDSPLLPKAPVLGSATNKKAGIYLTWSRTENALSYQVLRKDDPSAEWTVLDRTTAFSYTDASAVSGVDYIYTVRGLASDGTPGPSDAEGLKISRVAEPVVTTSICETGTLVSWDPVPGAAKYYVYRKLSTETWVRVATVKSGSSWVDKDVKNGEAWKYTVKARRVVDGVNYNSSHTAGTPSLYLTAPDNTIGARVSFTKIKISWDKNAFASGYEVQYATDEEFSKGSHSEIISDPDLLTTQIDGLTKGKIYYIRVRSLGSIDGKQIFSAWSSTFSVDTLLNPSIDGLCLTFTRKATKTIRDTITIKNAAAGDLYLQYYDPSTKKWVTKVTYELTGAKSQKITMQYSGDWKKKLTTKWRVYIPKASDSRAYKSKTIQVNAQNIKTLKLASPSAVIVRGSDGAVLYNKNAYQAREMASTTKMMTALLVMENLKMKDKITYTKEADNTGWGSIYAEVGSRFYCKDLLHALLIESSNDAATAFAQHISGSVSKFAKKMTKRAEKLGCKDTNYNNPHGLHGKTHHSTAYDLSLIQRECYKHEIYRTIILKKKYTFQNLEKTYTHTAYTTDDLLEKNISGFKGGKTGWIEEAGCCFSGIYEYKGETYFFTVLGSKKSDPRWKDCETLMAYIKKYA